jgi:hypothetical protein
MAWTWSHSPEACEAALNNVAYQERQWLEAVWVEWCVHDVERKDNQTLLTSFWSPEYARLYATYEARSRLKTTDYLREFIRERVDGYRTCTNGGHNAYGCPYGCLPHLLPFEQLETMS